MYIRTSLPASLANGTCVFFRGTIVIPKNSEENEFVASLQDETWLGIRRVNGIFVDQYTGAPLDYTNWKDGKPAYRNGNEDCAFMSAGGLWNDIQCTFQTQVTCQMYVSDCWKGYEDQRCFTFT
ncbi:mannose-binding protein C-like [Penaeus japonicus]|uniref:mannose-binding protein C-like n=1 Tax=Penaeus japonicus TaxID=27405 RepID=UPI001C717339|nr:mannose-binding protein C-like [Penaeus japonicus]